MSLTIARLKELLHYDEETGHFVWLKNHTRYKVVGKVAEGTVNGYRSICIDGRRYYAHRLAWFYMTEEWPSDSIDHIDGDKLNNTWVNLRDVAHSVNMENQRSARSDNKTTGVLGAYMHKNGRFYSAISVAGKTKRLGYFDTVDEAHSAYVDAKRKYHKGCTL